MPMCFIRPCGIHHSRPPLPPLNVLAHPDPSRSRITHFKSLLFFIFFFAPPRVILLLNFPCLPAVSLDPASSRCQRTSSLFLLPHCPEFALVCPRHRDGVSVDVSMWVCQQIRWDFSVISALFLAHCSRLFLSYLFIAGHIEFARIEGRVTGDCRRVSEFFLCLCVGLLTFSLLFLLSSTLSLHPDTVTCALMLIRLIPGPYCLREITSSRGMIL